MKTTHFFATKLAFTLLLCTFSFTAFAQITSIWQGGKPGRSTDWNCASNWSKNRVPDEFTQVIIPSNVLFFPVVKSDVDPIDALMMESGSSLIVEPNGKLVVLCETGIFDGVTLLGHITNHGTLQIGEMPQSNDAQMEPVCSKGASMSPSLSSNEVASNQFHTFICLQPLFQLYGIWTR